MAKKNKFSPLDAFLFLCCGIGLGVIIGTVIGLIRLGWMILTGGL